MARAKNLFYVVAFLASLHSTVAEEGSGQSDTGPLSHQHNEGSNNGKQNPFGNVIDGFSSFGNLGSSGGSGNPFGGLGSIGNPFSGTGGNPFSSLGGSGNPFSGFASAFGFPLFGSRQGEISHPDFKVERSNNDEPIEIKVNDKRKEESESDSQSEEEPESRFFFSSLFNTRLRTCNYMTQNLKKQQYIQLMNDEGTGVTVRGTIGYFNDLSNCQPGASCSSCREVLRCRPNNVGTVKRCGLFFPYCNDGRCSLFPGAACNSATTAVAAETTTIAAATTAAATTAAPTTV